MAASPAQPLLRKAYRRREVETIFGASLHSIDRAIGEGKIRTKHFGRCVFLHAGDVETVFGFENSVEVSAETLSELRDLLA